MEWNKGRVSQSQTYLRLGSTVLLAAALAATTACFEQPKPPTDEQIRQDSAQATRDLKKGAADFAHDAKDAAKGAARGLNDVAQGVNEGLKNGDGKNSGSDGDSSRVDINSASTARLALLPGISLSKAHDIVKGRPWKSTRSLVTRGLLTREQYGDVADQITAR